MTGDAERRKRRKASEAAAASVKSTVATEAPEPPAAPDNSPEMEVEPVAPDQNRLLLMTAEHEAAMAALRRRAAAPPSPPTVRPCVCSAGARRWPWELDILQTDPPTEKWCSAGCDDIRRGQELWREAWIEADTSRWGSGNLWGEYNPWRGGETKMELLRHRLARCRKKSRV